MFGVTQKRKLAGVAQVLTYSQRGIHKRIDENRELLELLQERDPEFLEKHFWVEGWLRSQDEFLSDLLTALPVPNPIPASNDFPRPWPTATTKETHGNIPNQRWIEHAYPLKRITAQAQGTRHSDLKDMADQLRQIADLIAAGHLTGQEDDDDFGYRFSVEIDKAESIFPDR